jgi:hypothetical protein
MARARALPGVCALVSALLGAACGSSAPLGPVPLAVAPRRGSSAAATSVVITGVGFDAAVKTDYNASGSRVNAAFAARLVPWDGSAATDLTSVAFTQERTLTAVVPAGLAAGRYDISVTDPAGNTGVLPDGFEVTSDAASAVGFRIASLSAQSVGVPFAVSLSAVDASGRVVSGFTGSVAITDASGTAVPTSSGPFVLGHATPLVAVGVAHAANVLTVSDGAGRTGASNAFDVGVGGASAIAFAAIPAVSASACSAAVALELRDGSGSPSAASAPVTVALQSGPPGALLFFADAACATPVASVAIPAGATGASFHLRGAAAGTASLRAVPDLLPSATASVAVGP